MLTMDIGSDIKTKKELIEVSLSNEIKTTDSKKLRINLSMMRKLDTLINDYLFLLKTEKGITLTKSDFGAMLYVEFLQQIKEAPNNFYPVQIDSTILRNIGGFSVPVLSVLDTEEKIAVNYKIHPELNTYLNRYLLKLKEVKGKDLNKSDLFVILSIDFLHSIHVLPEGFTY